VTDLGGFPAIRRSTSRENYPSESALYYKQRVFVFSNLFSHHPLVLLCRLVGESHANAGTLAFEADQNFGVVSPYRGKF